MVFYEKYSERVFNNTMIDLIMKSTGKDEEEAKKFYADTIFNLRIEDPLCDTGLGASLRQGRIQLLMDKGINFSDFFKESVGENYDLSMLSLSLFRIDNKGKFIIADEDADIVAWGYEKDMESAFRTGYIIIGEK